MTGKREGKKKKILHIVEAMGGGIFTYIVELANGLSDEFDVTIAYGNRDETPDNSADYFKDNVHLICVQNFTRNLNPIKDMKACFEVRKIVRQVSPDIIHMHSSKAGAIGRLMISDKKYKMFYTPHGYSFFMEDIPKYKRYIYKQIEKLCGKRNCLTVACGKGEWEESHQVTSKSTYVSNGINLDRINRVLDRPEQKDVLNRPNQKDSEHEFTVYTVGRISYQKNPELFNEIAMFLPDVQFMWIGEGDMKECLTSSNIRITGWAEADEVIELSKKGDVFVLPSRWEGLPISLLEAMYMRKPCIVSDVVGNRDMISNRKNGYICNTAEEFADVIRELIKNKDSRITDNARATVLENYNSAGLCQGYRNLYLKT